MTTKIWTRLQTQKIINSLRGAGYTVERDSTGRYTGIDAGGNVIFKALPGARGYLIIHAEGIFQYA